MKFQKKTLPNGLTILFEKRDVPVTTVMLATKFGSAYESEEEKGIAHFIEHSCFKGTKKRTAEEIAKTLEGVGGELNAFTHEEITSYHVKLPSSYLELAMDVIFDVFFNPTFPKEELEKERRVILEEIKMYKDNPKSYTIEKVKAALYEKPFGMFIAGTPETLKSFDREKILNKHRKIYCPGNSILCVVGNNDFDRILKLAEKFSVERDGVVIPEPKINLLEKSEIEKRAGVHQTNLALGFHFPKADERKSYAAYIFSSVLGEGMSSRLFREVREKRGLVYEIRSDLDLGKNYGYMLIWAGTSPEKSKEVIEICLKEFKEMKNLSEKELEEAKRRLIGEWYVDSENSNTVAMELILNEIYTKAEDYYTYPEKIKKVGLEEIKELASNNKFSSFVLEP